MLFVGDLGFEGENKILESGIDLESELLKVGHHGSRYSSSDEFLESVKPDISVISAGRNNMYGHPTEETLNRLSDVDTEIYCTKTQGTICVEVGEYLSVENYIGGWIKN
jgi:competence protein ComEC